MNVIKGLLMFAVLWGIGYMLVTRIEHVESVPNYIEFDTPTGMHCVKTDRALSCVDNREYAK